MKHEICKLVKPDTFYVFQTISEGIYRIRYPDFHARPKIFPTGFQTRNGGFPHFSRTP